MLQSLLFYSVGYYVFIISSFLHEENFKDTKGVISSRKAKDTDHIMTKIKETKGQAIIYKALSGTILGNVNRITLTYHEEHNKRWLRSRNLCRSTYISLICDGGQCCSSIVFCVDSRWLFLPCAPYCGYACVFKYLNDLQYVYTLWYFLFLLMILDMMLKHFLRRWT